MKSTITEKPSEILQYLKTNFDFRNEFPALMGAFGTDVVLKRMSYKFLPHDTAIDRLEQSCSLQALKSIQADFGDVHVAMNLNHHAARHGIGPTGYHDTWDNRIALDERQDFIFRLIQRFCNPRVMCTGHFWYPKNSWCAWHTNTAAWCPGERLYLIWAAEADKSFFRYIDPHSGNVITKWEKEGWQLNQFQIDTPEPFWHCVGSYTDRIAIGLGIPREDEYSNAPEIETELY